MPNNEAINHGNLEISKPIYNLVADEIIPNTGIDVDHFWSSFQTILNEFVPRNQALLRKRDQLQAQIDSWHLDHRSNEIDLAEYKTFLKKINYIIDEGPDFEISTENVDDEIATIAAPQLVVPINNARFALNASNARWGSLFDAFYGTDAIPESEGLEKGASFNPKRGQQVIANAIEFLDEVLPLTESSHKNVSAYNLLTQDHKTQLQIYLNNGHIAELKNSKAFIAFNENGNTSSLLFKNNGLHIEIQIDPCSPIGQTTLAGLKDIILEAALTTIQDCEDSVTAVDAEDKVLVYKNWLGLMNGSLEVSLEKNGKVIKRALKPDRKYTTTNGETLTLSGRSLLLVRNVGHLMTSNAVFINNNQESEEVPEGILDGMMTALAFLHDFKGLGRFKNSEKNSLYIVKPKMHGPDEVRFTVDLFSAIETALGLPKNTMKIGIMDEERRTTINLKSCIREAKDRLIFINTGFLDRTGDEIHTSIEAGVFLNKSNIKKQPWISAYEDWNVDIGLSCGLQGKAQIGKGMWAMPDLMADMISTKIQHPLAGANCAWVPSPTAATLHAMHYHKVNVSHVQQELSHRPRANLDDILAIPLMSPSDGELHPQQILASLDNNAQSILGYVVRWIDSGIGCSKVPDTHDVDLMEDRATLRISSQLLANWLLHNVITEEQIIESFKKMALVVDRQNSKDSLYKSMAPEYSGIAFKASLDLVLKGREQVNGYTEPLLHQYRRLKKAEVTR